MNTFKEMQELKERRSEELLREINEASPERKRELFLKHCPLAAFVLKNRDKVKITWS